MKDEQEIEQAIQGAGKTAPLLSATEATASAKDGKKVRRKSWPEGWHLVFVKTGRYQGDDGDYYQKDVFKLMGTNAASVFPHLEEEIDHNDWEVM